MNIISYSQKFLIEVNEELLYNRRMEKNIREPKQERSIQKKEAIVKAAYSVFSDVGYYNTNTADIAKKANVSTGIVYSYFKDKRDILFYVIKIYIEDVTKPIEAFIDNLVAPVDIHTLSSNAIDLAIKLHQKNANLHNILHSLADTQEDINEEFMELESHVTKIFTDKLFELGINNSDLTEKVHIAMNLVQSFAHEYLYDKHEYIDYEAMKANVLKCLIALFD